MPWSPRQQAIAGPGDTSGHVFVDESKQRDYLLVAAVISPTALDTTRKAIRALVMPGQRRVHMKKEGSPRRSAIIDTIIGAGVRATIYNAGHPGRHELTARSLPGPLAFGRSLPTPPPKPTTCSYWNRTTA